MNRTYVGLGLFVVATFGLLFWLAQSLGALKTSAGNTYYVELDSAAGLVEQNAVKLAGVPIGHIESVGVAHDKALLTLHIDREVALRQDTSAIVRAKSLLGEKYLELDPGTLEEARLEPGSTIRRVLTHFEIDEVLNALEPMMGGEDSLMASIAPLAQTLKELLDDATGKNGGEPVLTRNQLRTMANDAQATLASLRRITESNEEGVKALVTEAKKLASDPRWFALLNTANTKLPSILERLERVTMRLDQGTAHLLENGGDAKLRGLIDESEAAATQLRSLAETANATLQNVSPLLSSLAKLAKRAASVDEAALREFLQREGVKVYVGSKREAMQQLNP